MVLKLPFSSLTKAVDVDNQQVTIQVRLLPVVIVLVPVACSQRRNSSGILQVKNGFNPLASPSTAEQIAVSSYSMSTP